MAKPKGMPKTGGRVKGTPNKVSAAVKEYLTAAITRYMQPAEKGSAYPTLDSDLMQMQPVERVRAMATLAGYIIPKQQAISIDEQAKIEEEALKVWVEKAPEEAINDIAAKVLEMQARHKEQIQRNN